MQRSFALVGVREIVAMRHSSAPVEALLVVERR